MKRLMIILITCVALISCKKTDEQKPTDLYDVSFVFNPDGNESDITVIDQQTGDTKTYLKQTSTITITKQVKIFDKFYLEMKGKANGGDDQYNIKIIYKNVVIATDRAFGGSVVKDQILKIDKTFTSDDFKL